MLKTFYAAVISSCLAAVPALPAAAQSSPAPVPAASATPAGTTDPCTSLSNVVSRPTFSTSACAVKPGDLLIESGYANSSSSGGNGAQAVSFPSATLRAGIGKNFEADFVPPSYERASGAPAQAGESDSAIGFKYELGYTSKAIFGINVLETLPSGSAAFSSNGTGTLANANASLTLSPALSLFSTIGYNAQNAGTVEAPSRYHGFDPSLGASLSLPQSFNVFVEGLGMSSRGPGSDGTYGYDAGFTKDVGSRLQVDAEYFFFPSVQTAGHLKSIGFGASYLFGK